MERPLRARRSSKARGAGKRREERRAGCRSAHPPQAAAWQCPSSGKQQAVPRALQPHTLPFQISSSYPRPWLLPHSRSFGRCPELTTPRQRQTGESGDSPPFFSLTCLVLNDHLASWFYEYSYICHLEMQEAICIKIPTQWLPFSVPLRDLSMYFFSLKYK